MCSMLWCARRWAIWNKLFLSPLLRLLYWVHTKIGIEPIMARYYCIRQHTFLCKHVLICIKINKFRWRALLSIKIVVAVVIVRIYAQSLLITTISLLLAVVVFAQSREWILNFNFNYKSINYIYHFVSVCLCLFTKYNIIIFNRTFYSMIIFVCLKRKTVIKCISQSIFGPLTLRLLFIAHPKISELYSIK